MNFSPTIVPGIGWLTVISASAGTALAAAIIFWPEPVIVRFAGIGLGLLGAAISDATGTETVAR